MAFLRPLSHPQLLSGQTSSLRLVLFACPRARLVLVLSIQAGVFVVFVRSLSPPAARAGPIQLSYRGYCTRQLDPWLSCD